MNAPQQSTRGTKINKAGPYYTDTTWDPVRVAGAGLGGAAVAYGVPRARFVQAGLARGQGGVGNAASLARAAERVRIAAEFGTEPIGHFGGAAMRATPEGRYLMDRMPRRLRIGAATLGGALLLHRSVPPTKVRRRRIVGVTGE